MDEDFMAVLERRLDESNFKKLMKIKNPQLHDFIARYIHLCNPSSVFVSSDTPEDIGYIKEAALRNKEEAPLESKGHTIHFDAYRDQARDKENTKFLLNDPRELGPELNTMNRDDGLTEIHELLVNIMEGKELYIRFYCLGPTNSVFTIPCLQLTDSAYVAHCEDLLYRFGYKEFVRQGDKNGQTFKFIHSQGEVIPAGLGLKVCKNLDKRRIYMDMVDETIFSINTQYGGNTIGMKKLAMRLAINRASKEGWLTEHMLIVGVSGKDGRRSYLTGAFPSMCGKTSTAMIGGEHILGDDIAFLRKINGKIRAVNVEKGMFGIIRGINSNDDPEQFKALTSPGEIIFSNVLVTEDRKVFWGGKDGECPEDGVNHSGEWHKGKAHPKYGDIPSSHKNARFTISLETLENVDKNLHNPKGVVVSGIIYGGRDSTTGVPVEESFDWKHGIITKGAALESETTAATIGTRGVKIFNPMSNIDFLSIPVGTYIENNLKFAADLKKPPKIFSVNYFLKDITGKYLNHKNDKHVWLKWMEHRVNNELKAVKAPTGMIPIYDDLVVLFEETLGKTYPEGDYVTQFTIRVPNHIEKIRRALKTYAVKVLNTPDELFTILEQQIEDLENTRARYGNFVSPFDLYE